MLWCVVAYYSAETCVTNLTPAVSSRLFLNAVDHVWHVYAYIILQCTPERNKTQCSSLAEIQLAGQVISWSYQYFCWWDHGRCSAALCLPGIRHIVWQWHEVQGMKNMLLLVESLLLIWTDEINKQTNKPVTRGTLNPCFNTQLLFDNLKLTSRRFRNSSTDR